MTETDFAYRELFDLAEDATPYRKLASGPVAVASFKGRRVATPLCGGNVTAEQARRWLLG